MPPKFFLFVVLLLFDSGEVYALLNGYCKRKCAGAREIFLPLLSPGMRACNSMFIKINKFSRQAPPGASPGVGAGFEPRLPKLFSTWFAGEWAQQKFWSAKVPELAARIDQKVDDFPWALAWLAEEIWLPETGVPYSNASSHTNFWTLSMLGLPVSVT